jgi:SAM-dependent methyltransferase
MTEGPAVRERLELALRFPAIEIHSGRVSRDVVPGRVRAEASGMTSRLRTIARWALPISVRRAVVRGSRWPPVGQIRFGTFRRVQPVSRIWGGDRGLPVDRYYIDAFLSSNGGDIQGRVLEVSDNSYTRRFGADRVSRSDVLDVAPDNPKATIIADLVDAPHLPSDTFDCVICTQTLQYIPDVASAVATLHRILRPGGVLLLTLPGISQTSRHDMERSGDYWRFTDCSARWLLSRSFRSQDVQVDAFGNVLAAVSFLHGLAAGELRQGELDYHDPDYQVSITVRAVKRADAG